MPPALAVGALDDGARVLRLPRTSTHCHEYEARISYVEASVIRQV
ncbi:hypothetical protein [Streptomyces viridosporus]|nr:hypothetical protein [Streptomyces viridosporus]